MMKDMIATMSVVMATSLWLTSGASLEDARRLQSDLLSNYCKNIRPVLNQSEPVVVEFTLHPISLVEVNEIDQSFAVNIWMNLSWWDEQLVWNASDYGGISKLHMDTNQLWLPLLLLPNSLGEREPFSDMSSRVTVSSDGHVEWYPGNILKFTCSIIVRYFPFDSQKCDIKVMAVGYTRRDLVLVPSETGVSVGGFGDHNEWDLILADLEKPDGVFGPRLTANFVFARRPAIHVLNIILPVALLSLLSVLVFLLPAESGERVSFAFTSLLSITMYMSIVGSQLPRASDSLPLVTVYLSVLLVLNVVAVVATCLSLLCHHRYQVARANPHARQSQPAIVLVKEMDRGDKAGDDGLKDEDDASKRMWVSVWSRDWAALLDKVFFVGLALTWVACTLVFMVVISSGGCDQDDCLQ